MVSAEGARRGWGSMCAEDPVKPQWKRGCVRRCLCLLPPVAPSFLLPPTPLKVMVCALPCWFFHQLLLHPWHTLLLAPPFLCPVPVMFCCSYNAQVFLLLHPWKVGQPQKLMH